MWWHPRVPGARGNPHDMSLIRSTGTDGVEGREPADYCVLSDGSVGDGIADRLRADGHDVQSLDVGLPVDDASEPQSTVAVGLDEASTVVVATRLDGRNLLLAQQAETRFDIDRVLVLVHDPPQLGSFEAAGHEPVCATTAPPEAVIDGL